MPSIVYSPSFLQHDTGQHPECAARLVVVRDHLGESGLDERWTEIAAREATAAELARVHSPDHLSFIETVGRQGGGRLDPDTVMSAGSLQAAREGAGAVMIAADRAMAGDVAFSLVRPPGHHARPGQAMGFCLYNNVAIAARYLQVAHGIQRVAIFDFDVHHGNGTQEIFYADPTVHFTSIHRYPFWPGSGASHETGEEDGHGATVNVPLAGDVPRERYLDEVRRVVDDHLKPFAPEALIFSAGFDGYAYDPIGGLGLAVEDYYEITRLVIDGTHETTRGRVLSALEGGYALDALGPLVASHLEALAD